MSLLGTLGLISLDDDSDVLFVGGLHTFFLPTRTQFMFGALYVERVMIMGCCRKNHALPS